MRAGQAKLIGFVQIGSAEVGLTLVRPAIAFGAISIRTQIIWIFGSNSISADIVPFRIPIPIFVTGPV